MAKPPKISDEQFEAQKRVWVMCGKVGFETEKRAQIKALEYGLTYYRCPHCNNWHLTKGRWVLDAIRRSGVKY